MIPLTMMALKCLVAFGPPSGPVASPPSAETPPSPGNDWPAVVEWTPEHYALDLAIDYESQQIRGEAEITVRNQGDGPLGILPVLLYRLMQVTGVQGPNGQDLAFSQGVETYEDYDRLQVDFIQVTLPEPVEPGDRITVSLDYQGYLAGLSEAYPYVKETIDPAFTIIRDDSDAYPTIGYPSRNANRFRPMNRWSYDARITVPDSLVVANGGELVQRNLHNGLVTYYYRSRVPSWRMDFAVAPYVSETSGNNTVFALPEDAGVLPDLLTAMDRALALYTEWFGPLKAYDGLAVIEIPQGFGSQTDATAIIQRAEAFKDPSRFHELDHELSHKWNVKATDEHPPRIEEGLAVFLESLTVEALEDRSYLDSYMDSILDYLRGVYARHPERASVPLARYGDAGMEGMSYTVGAVFFRLLYARVGPEAFRTIFRDLYAQQSETGADIQEVMAYIRNDAGTHVDDLLQDWIFGTRYGELIRDGAGIEDLLAIYSSPPP